MSTSRPDICGALIKAVCGDGSQWDLQINYTEEQEPLGTIGPLSLLRDRLDSTFLVINGDVLTDLNFNAFTTYHRQRGSALTIATATRTIKMDYGVIEGQNGRVTQFREKPILSQMVSMGVYCMEPQVLDYIPSGVPFGFDDLMLCVMDRGMPVHTFEHNGLWLDVGRVQDFQQAQELNWDDQPPRSRSWPRPRESGGIARRGRPSKRRDGGLPVPEGRPSDRSALPFVFKERYRC